MSRLIPICMIAFALAACGGGENADAPENDTACTAPEREEVEPKGPSISDRQEANKLFNEAQFAAMNHDNTRAAELFFDALELNPEFKEAHANLARVLYDLGRYTESYDHFLHASELEDVAKDKQFLVGKAVEACLANARKAEKAGEYKLAEEFVNDAHALVPENYETLYLLGSLRYSRGEYEEARDSYADAAEISMSDSRRGALFMVGLCSYMLQEYEKAEGQFSVIVKEGYSARDVFGYRGYCRYKLNDYQGAIEDFQQAQEHATSSEKAQEYADVEVQLTKALEGND